MPSTLQTLTDLNKAGFKPLSEEKSKHYAAIGRLMMVVSNEVDAKLNGLLQTMLGGDEISSRAVVGEMRIPDVMAAIRRIATARALGKDTIDKMEAVFSEITSLRQARDVIAHKAIWAKGNKMAFHNALIAKTESAIEIIYFTINELNEFSRYAKLLGFRVQLLMPLLVTLPKSSAQNAFLLLISQHLITLAASAKLKMTPNISKARLLDLQNASEKSHLAVKALTEFARPLDPKFGEAQRAASDALVGFATVLTQLDAPELETLLEIPERLRPKRQRQEIARPQRPRRSS